MKAHDLLLPKVQEGVPNLRPPPPAAAAEPPAMPAVHWAGQGGLKHMRLVGLQRLAGQHGVDVSQYGESPQKIKAFEEAL